MHQTRRLHRFLAPGPCSPGQVVTLAPEPSRHMVTVLRIGAGGQVRLFTEDGCEYLAVVEDASPAEARVRIIGECAPGPLRARLTLAFAPPPGQRADLLIEKATELGADALQPVLCERLQGFQANAAGRRAERWQRKAHDAARQCERADVPEVHAPERLENFLSRTLDELRLVASPGAPGLWGLLSGVRETHHSVALLVGPAGGLTSAEQDAAERAGFRPVSLGPRILRVETAALALLAGVVLWLEGMGQTADEGSAQ